MLWPALRANPEFAHSVVQDVVQLRPEFEWLTRSTPRYENELTRLMFRRGGAAFLVVSIAFSVACFAFWYYPLFWIARSVTRSVAAACCARA